MRRLLRSLHVYAGLLLSLALFVLAATGSALVYKEAYWRLVYPELREPALDLDAAQHAAAIAAARARFGDALRSVKLPEPGVGAYHLYLQDGEAFLSADRTVIDEWRTEERLMSLLFDLHAHLMAGDAGERVGGVIGLLGVIMALSGLVLWWPTRRRFSLAGLAPRELSRRTLRAWHRNVGMLATPLLLVLLLTGSGLVFYDAALSVLRGLLGGPTTAAVSARPAVPASAQTPLTATMLARVGAALPGARIVFYYPPGGERGRVHGFRLKAACELHPNGRSTVELDGSGAIVSAVDACALAAGDRATHALYPLHAGKTPSGLYRLAVFTGGIVLALLALTGVVTYVGMLLRRRDRPRPAGPARERVGRA